MSSELKRLMDELQKSTEDGVNILLDIQRRRALYPTVEAAEKRTKVIRMNQVGIPLNESNMDTEHLLYHIDLLRKELRKQTPCLTPSVLRTPTSLSVQERKTFPK